MVIVPITPLNSILSLSEVQKEGQSGAAVGLPFADVLKNAIQTMEETQAISQQDSIDVALGRTDDLHTVQINSAKAEAAVSLATGLTSKALSVYNEIIRMQI